MTRFLPRRFAPAVSIGAAFVLCGASPAPEGNQTTVGVGIGTYEHRSGGCGGTRRRYSVTEPLAHLLVRQRTDNNTIWAGEVDIGVGMLGDSREDPDEIAIEDDLLDAGQTFWSGMMALRWGKQYRLAGFELGPAIAHHRRLGGWSPIPSGGVWVGKPTLAYAWADVFQGPFGGALEFGAMAGIGHQSRFLRLQVGSNIRAHVANLDLTVGPGVRLGAHVGYGETWRDQAAPDLRGMLRLTIDYRAFSRPGEP